MRLGLAIAAAMMLAACSTTYQPAGLTGGYDEIQLNATTYRVKAGGNGFTSPDRVESIMLLRAAELTLQNGYSHFLIVGGDGTQTRTSFAGFTSGTAYTTGNLTASRYGNTVYGSGSATTTYTPATPQFVERSSSDIVIEMIKSSDPRSQQAFDAQLIAGQLRVKLGVK